MRRWSGSAELVWTWVACCVVFDFRCELGCAGERNRVIVAYCESMNSGVFGGYNEFTRCGQDLVVADDSQDVVQPAAIICEIAGIFGCPSICVRYRIGAPSMAHLITRGMGVVPPLCSVSLNKGI